MITREACRVPCREELQKHEERRRRGRRKKQGCVEIQFSILNRFLYFCTESPSLFGSFSSLLSCIEHKCDITYMSLCALKPSNLKYLKHSALLMHSPLPAPHPGLQPRVQPLRFRESPAGTRRRAFPRISPRTSPKAAGCQTAVLRSPRPRVRKLRKFRRSKPLRTLSLIQPHLHHSAHVCRARRSAGGLLGDSIISPLSSPIPILFLRLFAWGAYGSPRQNSRPSL